MASRRNTNIGPRQNQIEQLLVISLFQRFVRYFRGDETVSPRVTQVASAGGAFRAFTGAFKCLSIFRRTARSSSRCIFTENDRRDGVGETQQRSA